ncbi:AraC family transcriptional regulator [Brenneria tiliae]|uniref:AraC family transcriptional regulator n=1 Tax=Brenneria tiliae TaxID=2914984 RepID=A0ABT0MYA4_9GAMM|nr:AraC family transcriptional regulator [Brenneria tiliae]MCL2894557.1 AraC family transcriptional regulator [Brenneria tiliae]MCL2896899.1 AraC family transcriptional regulator [Brenneria tiliae]MCL2901457.1 AraC family transcriptional regulator [Brenneria tiliae]
MRDNEWLLENLRVESSVFHIGKYCGSWQGSTAGQGKSSYHIVMEGDCWLHAEQDPEPIALERGDMVFIFQDCPFVLSNHREKDAALRAPGKKMQPLHFHDRSSTALVCGFLTFHSVISHMILSFLPPKIIIRKQKDEFEAVRKITEVIHHEAAKEEMCSHKLISSLAEALLFIGIRQYLHQHPLAPPLETAKNMPEFLNLIATILLFPAREWTIPKMADAMAMSRSWFIQRFSQVSAVPPAEMVCQLRMSLACRYIEQGKTLQQTAEMVGYQSIAAFNRAFRRIIGVTPGKYRGR